MRAFGVVLFLALAGCAGPAGVAIDAPAEERIPADALATPGVRFFNMTVGGEPAMGLVAVPASAPKVLLVFCKGLDTGAGVYVELFSTLAERGILAVAMDYRGAPDAFKIATGVEDTLAATLALRAAFPSVDRALLVGGSMGGAVSGIVLAKAPPGTFEHWFVAAGTVDLVATWAELPLLRPRIEAETGGSPLDVPAEYEARSPLANVEGIAFQGLRRAWLLYGTADMVVPHEHAERMFHALREAGVPVSLYTVTTDPYAYTCTPFALYCTIVPTSAPAGHEVAWLGLEWPLIENRLAGLPEPEDLAVRGVYDGTTGSYWPSDTA